MSIGGAALLLAAAGGSSGDGGMQMPPMTGHMWMPMDPPTFARVIGIHLQPIPVVPALTVAALLAYAIGVGVLHRRGDKWPVSRSVWWGLGIVTVLGVTANGVDGYGMELFSIHMIQHMMLSMLSPVFLVLGAPITLMLRVLPAGSGRWNARRLVLRVVHSGIARFFTHPAVTVVLFLMSLYGLYFTPAFDYLMGRMWGHNLMLIHFVLIGMLYFWNVMGVDPSPREKTKSLAKLDPTILRLIEIFVTVPFHAFFGVVVMMSSKLIVNYYHVSMFGIDPLHDQAVGGGIAWAFTELPTVIVIGALIWEWQKSDARRAKRQDRQAERNGDADRIAYNEYLEALARSDSRAASRTDSPSSPMSR